jgi:hypothetical protein
MNDERLKQMIKKAVTPVTDVEPKRDLWPSVLQRIEQHPLRVAAFDWLLAAAVLVWAVVFPEALVALLYHL